MTLNELQALTNAEKDRYMAMGRLFEHPSYKFLMNWAKSSVDECMQRELNAGNWEFILLQRGGRLAYKSLVDLEANTEAEFEGIAQQRIEEAALAKVDLEQSPLDDV